MGDDHDPPAPGPLPPWERALADRRYRESHSSGRLGRRAQPPTEGLSVADLVKKVADEDEPQDPVPYDPDRTEVIAPITDDAPRPGGSVPPSGTVPPDNPAPPPSLPPPGRPDPAAVDWAAETIETAAIPQAVGTGTLTRLALSRNRRRKRLRIAARSLVALVSVVALGATGLVWGYLRTTEGKFSQIAALDIESDDIIDAHGQLGDETYLIVGTDTRVGASGEIGAGTIDDAEGARADTVMLVNIPADRSRVVAVSFPRDLDVERPECEAWDNDTGTYSDETYPSAYWDKLNATYALGGPKCLVKVIQKMSGLKIGYFVGMDFAGFESMVNEIGGVNICTTGPLEDGILGTVLPAAGNHNLDGRTALNYVRARHVDSEGNGDYGRITRQQKFLSALLRGALSGDVLLNPGKLNGFINAFTRETFVETIDTTSLMTLGRSMQNVDAGAVTFLTVPTAGTNEWGNEIPRTDDITSIFRAIIDDDPLPGEERSTPAPGSAPEPTEPSESAMVDALPPSEASVQVSNASGISGAAATTADNLSTYGFQIYSVGNYTETSSDTLVRFGPGYGAEAATVASAIPGAVLEETSGLGAIVEVVIGSRTATTVVAPADPGAPLDATPARIGKSEPVEIPSDLAVVNAGDATCE